MSDANKQFQQQINSANEELAQLRQQLQAAQEQAYRDTLTQLYNRLAFNEQLEQLISNPTVAQSTCLVLADIDHFKSFNDNYGHLIGDRVLQKMGEIISDHCPDNCIGARYGGEEFAVIVTNSNMEQAAEIAETLRQRLRQLRVKVKSSDKVLNNISASFGVAQYLPQESINSLIDRADKALYAAKDQGRDCVVCFDNKWRAAQA
jgi:diguanylate cyclase